MGKLPPNTKLVTRRSKWGNPFNLSEYTREESLVEYRKWLQDQIQTDKQFIEPLKGFDLACGCELDEKCHADIILELLNKKKSYCSDCNKWLYSDTCDCCPYHMKDEEYHFMDTPEFAKKIHGLNYLEEVVV